jgi:hypothetical protein
MNKPFLKTDFSPPGQFQQVAASILLIEQSFQFQIEKLQTARKEGIINEREYKEWFELFDSFRREWLEKDFTKSENILFLKFMSRQYYKKAKDLKFTAK